MKKAAAFLIGVASVFHLPAQVNLGSTVLQNTVVATNLSVPWDLAYGADGWIWLTELSGNIKRMNPDTYEVQQVFALPDVALFGFSVGLHSIVLHPDFNNTPYLYVHYAYSQTNSKIVRYTYDAANNTLTGPALVLGNIPAGVSHNGSRMVILNDQLYISLGDTYSTPAVAQNPGSINGKVLRMNLDGSIPTTTRFPAVTFGRWATATHRGCVTATANCTVPNTGRPTTTKSTSSSPTGITAGRPWKAFATRRPKSLFATRKM